MASKAWDASTLSFPHGRSLDPIWEAVNRESTNTYMKWAFDDAASITPTSVLSSRTANRFRLAGLTLPSQDKGLHYLEMYTKQGKATTVRTLLESGCNPGTRKRPRVMPIFKAVRGATSKHAKCVQALLDYGVDLNVRMPSSSRTPLHYAIEHPSWSSYSHLIFVLLKGGANPNLSDSTGDVPLLQLLYGGVEPLSDHKREALALLVAPQYSTDVNISYESTGNTPLHLAVSHKDPWAVALLLKKDVSVNSKNGVGLTPLQTAAGLGIGNLLTDKKQFVTSFLAMGLR